MPSVKCANPQAWNSGAAIIVFSRALSGIRDSSAATGSSDFGWLREALGDCDWRVHTPEGALFLWLWLPRLSIPSAELYARLKARGVLVLSGHHFFPGLRESPAEHWPHRDQCLRITYARDEDTVRRGIAIIGDEARRWQR